MPSSPPMKNRLPFSFDEGYRRLITAGSLPSVRFPSCFSTQRRRETVSLSGRIPPYGSVGQTKGRGKKDVHKEYKLPKKNIWLYPLSDNYKSALLS